MNVMTKILAGGAAVAALAAAAPAAAQYPYGYANPYAANPYAYGNAYGYNNTSLATAAVHRRGAGPPQQSGRHPGHSRCDSRREHGHWPRSQRDERQPEPKHGSSAWSREQRAHGLQ